MTTPTREQIDAAVARLASFRKAFFASADIDDALATVIDAIPALTAELETERAAHADETQARSHSDAVRESLCDVLEMLGGDGPVAWMIGTSADDVRKEIRDLVGHLEERARHAEQAAHMETKLAADREISSLRRILDEQRDAWQTATGHASPEAYRSRVEPGAGVIERLAGIFGAAAVELQHADGRATNGQQVAAGVRAVVAALAEMGEMPGAVLEAAGRGISETIRCQIGVPLSSTSNDAARVAWSHFRNHLAPVLGARRALELPSEEEIEACLIKASAHNGSLQLAARAVLDLLRSRSAPPTDEQLAEEARAEAFHEAAVARREGRR